jgi:hypothetical protein
MLKRYEEYDWPRDPAMDAAEANREAVVVGAMVKVGPRSRLARRPLSLRQLAGLSDYPVSAPSGSSAVFGIISIAVDDFHAGALRAVACPRRFARSTRCHHLLGPRFRRAATQVGIAAPPGRRSNAAVVAGVPAVGASRVHIDNSLRSFGAACRARGRSDLTWRWPAPTIFTSLSKVKTEMPSHLAVARHGEDPPF